MKNLFLFLFGILLTYSQTYSQSVSINSSGHSPDPSAMLHIESKTKGLLIPRMDSFARTSISAAVGLLVYDTDQKSFYYYDGTNWINIGEPATLADQDNDTKIQVEESADEDMIRFDLKGSEVLKLRRNQHGILMVEPKSDYNNTFYGIDSGLKNEPIQSGEGMNNTFIGYKAGADNSEGARNTLLGSLAGFELDAGSGNVYLGYETGKFNTNGGGNVWIGNQVGNSGSGSNQLKIDNENSATPLVYGEFNNDLFRVNGDFQMSAQGVERFEVSENANDITSIQIFDQGENTIVGDSAGATLAINVLDGTRNTFLGYQAGQNANFSYGNTMVGYQAGQLGNGNIFSTGVGWRAGWKTEGNFNAYFGRISGLNNVNGEKNTFIGDGAGSSSSGSNNVFLGYRAGEDEAGSDKLYIANSEDKTPLIYGDFLQDEVEINGDLEVVNDLVVGDQISMNINNPTAPFHINLPNTSTIGARFQVSGNTKMSIHNNGGLSIGAYLTDNLRVPSNGLYVNGNVNIGTSTLHSTFKLQVDGKVACEEVNVELSQDWPDYVFKDDYELESLENIEAYIDSHGHLPGVPSASEVKSNGIYIGEMQKILMEKVEELTLHIIRLEKENKRLANLIKNK